MESPPGEAASKGSLFHANYELAAEHKKTTGELVAPINFFDEALKSLGPKDIENLNEASLYEVKKLLEGHTEYQEYLNKPILGIERRYKLIFDKNLNRLDDILVPQYYFNLPKEDVFSISGFIDLVLEEDEETLNIVDFKTGKPKTENALKKAIQPQLYFVAASYLYPQYKYIILTFDYIKDGPRHVTFHRDQIPEILQKVYETHLEIINTDLPKRPSRELWMCRYCLTPNFSAYNSECLRLYNQYSKQLEV